LKCWLAGGCAQAKLTQHNSHTPSEVRPLRVLIFLIFSSPLFCVGKQKFAFCCVDGDGWGGGDRKHFV
jgi:hypothetical protein